MMLHIDTNIMVIRSQINHGGAGELTCAVVRELKRRKRNVILVVGGGELINELDNSGIEICILPQLLTTNRTITHTYEAVVSVKKIMIDRKINMVCGMNSAATLVAYMAGKMLDSKISYINELFGSGKEKLHRWMPFLHVVASDEQKEKLIREYGFLPDQLDVNYPSTLDMEIWNPELYSAEDFRASISIPKNHIVIGSVMMGNKGSVDKWNAVEYLLHKYPYVDFLFLGNSTKFQSVLDRLKDIPEVARIHVVGVVNHALMPCAMKAMDIFSHFLGDDEYETFGMVITEAMSMRKPVVASRIGGIQNIIVDGINGYLVKSKEEYLGALMRLIEDRELRIHMGDEARRIVEGKFSLKRHVDVIEKLLGM